jgi:hypothetical protein
MKVILGAGLSGLICGALNAQALIYERNPSSFTSHRAILRFRDEKIARALGITFRRVTVRKAVWVDGRYEPPSPRLANLYSLKVRGLLTDSSIWSLAPSERFIAPDNLHALLAEICGTRVAWNHEITRDEIASYAKARTPVVSTIPLPLLLSLLSIPEPFPLRYSPIYVSRYELDDCDVFQTIYFPSPSTTVYRATLTGSLLTVEQTSPVRVQKELEDVMTAFGVSDFIPQTELFQHKQSFGKISPSPSGSRKALLHRLTTEWGIYSLGRFATWRNILLDDVYEDIAAIRRMMTQSHYDVTLERLKDQ